jgi:hypothetical protein
MRDKILAQLVSKFPGVSKQALGLIADKLAKKVTEESGIDQAITDFDNAISITDYAADLQREADRRVGEAKKEWDKKNPGKKDPTKTEVDNQEPANPDDMPAWAKQLMTQVEKLSKERHANSMQSRLAERLKDKVPPVFYKGRALPEKDEDFDNFVNEIETDYKTYQQELVDQGLMSATPPAGGTGGGKNGNEKIIDAQIDQWAGAGDKASDTKK